MEDLINAAQARDLAGVGKTSFYKLIRAPGAPQPVLLYPGARPKYSRAAFLRYLAERGAQVVRAGPGRPRKQHEEDQA